MRIYKATDRTCQAPYVITTSTHYVIVYAGQVVAEKDIPAPILMNNYELVYDATSNVGFASAIISIFDKIWGE